ncbi:hypothetical protein [Nocardia brasiliensis]|uniref:hypothetical protein n=1 Tax=Nocardia brasiliensis TaxID=37326 RepID=UPI0004A76166|nr:hypothetical protein [Nocardia brasiliensis]
MSGWLFLIVAFGSWTAAGFVLGVMFMSGRLRPAPYSSPGSDQETTTPGTGESDLAPGVASNTP